MTAAFLPGFGLGLSLILPIGAQNAFVLRQGLRGQHVFWICLVCAVSDAALIVAGVAGFGNLSRAMPGLEPVLRYGGAAFLILYGAVSLRNACRGGTAMSAHGGQAAGLGTSLLTVMAFTWLNPHVYLDTVMLIGSISVQYADRAGFGLGAICASFVFFFSLGYGAQLLQPVFARPRAWQVADGAIGMVMWAIAGKLLVM